MSIINYLIIKNQDKLSNSDIEILQVLEKHMDQVKDSTINELAAMTYTSASSFFRLVQKLGFNSFTEFKFYIKNEIDKSNKEFYFSNDIFLKNIKNQLDITDKINQDNIKLVAEALINSKYIYCYSTGWKQEKLSQNFISDISLYNIEISYIRSIEEFRKIKKSNDSTVIIVSYSGDLASYREKVKELKENKVKIIGICLNKNSPLDKISDISLLYINSDHFNDLIHWQTFSVYYIFEKIIYELSNLTVDN